jgi:hypothetical protein
MFKFSVIACLISLSFGGVQPLQAAAPATLIDLQQMVQEDTAYPIRPSEAALIAKDANPDAKVLGVKLLPSGVYAVTLKIGGSVSRVLVDATSGAIS